MNLFSIFSCVQFQFRHFFVNFDNRSWMVEFSVDSRFSSSMFICIGMCNVYVYQQVQLKPTAPKQCAQVQIITANAHFNTINIELSNLASN